jgi:hypothetical protein
VLAVSGLLVAAGLGRVTSVAADPPEAPGILAPAVATAEAVDDLGVPAVLVTLQGATPDATYTVSDCALNADGTTACAPTAAMDDLTTDGSGDASATLVFPGASGIAAVKIVNEGNASDTYTVTLVSIAPNVGS